MITIISSLVGLAVWSILAYAAQVIDEREEASNMEHNSRR